MPHYVITLKSGTTGIEKSTFIATMSLADNGGSARFPNRHVKIINSMSFSNINMEYSMSVAEAASIKNEPRVRFVTATPRTSSMPDQNITSSLSQKRLGIEGSKQKIFYTASSENSSIEMGRLTPSGHVVKSGSDNPLTYFVKAGLNTSSHQWATFYRGFGVSEIGVRRSTSSIASANGYEIFNPYHKQVNTNLGNWGLLRHNSKSVNPNTTSDYWARNFQRFRVPTSDFSPLKEGGRFVTHSYHGYIRPSSPQGAYSTDGANKPFTYHLDGTGVDLVICEFSTFNDKDSEFLDEKGNTRVVNYNWAEELGLGDNGTTLSNFYASVLGTLVSQNTLRGVNIGLGTGGGAHMTQAAKCAGGRWTGFGKGTKIYGFHRQMIAGENPIETPDGIVEASMIVPMNTMQWYATARRFHESKSIDPATGFKRPTVINDSTGRTEDILSQYQNQKDEGVSGNKRKTLINVVHYSGSSYDHTSSSIAHQGGTVTVVTSSKGNIYPKLEWGMVQFPQDWTGSNPGTPTSTTGTVDYGDPFAPPNNYSGMGHSIFSKQLPFVIAEMEELTKIPGVIYCKAAGNDNGITFRASNNPAEDEANGVRTEGVMEGYRTIHYNNYVIFASSSLYQTAGEPWYYLRADCSTDTVLVGALNEGLVPYNKSWMWGYDGSKTFPENQAFDIQSSYSNGPCDVWAASEFYMGSSFQGNIFSASLLASPAHAVISSSLHKTALGGKGYNRHLTSTSPFTYRGGPYSMMSFNYLYFSASNAVVPQTNTDPRITPSGLIITGSRQMANSVISAFPTDNERHHWNTIPFNLKNRSNWSSSAGINTGLLFSTRSMFYDEEKFDLPVGNPATGRFRMDGEDGNQTPVLMRLRRGGNNGSSQETFYRITQNITYVKQGGTSFASPLVAGLAACYMQLNPNATALDFKKWVKYHGASLQTTQSFADALEDTWTMYNNGIIRSNFASPIGFGHTNTIYTELVSGSQGLDENGAPPANAINIPSGSRPSVYTKAKQSVLVQPYNSAFKTNKRATFKRK